MKITKFLKKIAVTALVAWKKTSDFRFNTLFTTALAIIFLISVFLLFFSIGLFSNIIFPVHIHPEWPINFLLAGILSTIIVMSVLVIVIVIKKLIEIWKTT